MALIQKIEVCTQLWMSEFIDSIQFLEICVRLRCKATCVRKANTYAPIFGPIYFRYPLLRTIRDLKIGRRDELRRLPEVNLHTRACARELLPCEFAVVVTSRTPFGEFCRRVENVSIFILFWLVKRCTRFRFHIKRWEFLLTWYFPCL